MPPHPRTRQIKLGVLLVLLIGALNAFQNLGRQVEGVIAQRAMLKIPDDARVLNLFELQTERYDNIGYNFVGQYLGSVESPFARHLMAEAEPSVP